MVSMEGHTALLLDAEDRAQPRVTAETAKAEYLPKRVVGIMGSSHRKHYEGRAGSWTSGKQLGGKNISRGVAA